MSQKVSLYTYPGCGAVGGWVSLNVWAVACCCWLPIIPCTSGAVYPGTYICVAAADALTSNCPTTKAVKFVSLKFRQFLQCNFRLDFPEAHSPKSYMLSLTEYSTEYQNNACWDTLRQNDFEKNILNMNISTWYKKVWDWQNNKISPGKMIAQF